MSEIKSPGVSPGEQNEPEFDRIPRFARRVAVSKRCVGNWLKDGRIPFLKIGRAVLIPHREAIETLKQKYRLNARADTGGN